MPRERKNFYHELTFQDYDIAGNVFRAWCDESGKLIAVLDETVDEYKPYALLVMDSYGERKWYDVLSNDYNLDLEDIRPKKENKYQKLDIEYEGLEFYDRLINAYESGADVNAVLSALFDFRDAAVKRAATDRLVTASEIVAQSVKTATRAEHTISNMQDRQKKLYAKLEKYRNEVGREPTKQSAAKILRTESQIDKSQEILERAQKRRENANRRGDTAREDVVVARAVLASRRPKVAETQVLQDVEQVGKFVVSTADEQTETKYEEKYNEVYEQTEEYDIPEDKDEPNTDSAADITLPVPDYELQPETEETTMSETQDTEEVKPLLDKDPEILDEEIAFKPVEFEDIKPRVENNTVSTHVDTTREYKTETVETHEETLAQPSTFSEVETNVQSYDDKSNEYAQERPVLNAIHSVQEPVVADVDTTQQVTNTQYESAQTTVQPAPVVNGTMPASPINQSRPISPITGEHAKVQPVGASRQKPTVVYYLLLIMLIALSIFTLWLYQEKNGGIVPIIDGKGNGTEVVAHPDVIASGGSMFVEKTDTVPEPAVVEPDVRIVVDEPTPIVEPEPVVQPEVQEKPIDVIYPNDNILIGPEPDEPIVEPEDSVLSRKEPYGVSRESQMVYVPVEEPEQPEIEEPVVRVTTVTSPDVIFEDGIISVPVMAPDYTDEEEMYYNDDVEYYQEPQGYYQVDSGNYQEYGQQEYVEEDVDGGFVMESSNNRDPETHRYLSVHDGGQYSIGYTETTY